jgi:hypothetical protein
VVRIHRNRDLEGLKSQPQVANRHRHVADIVPVGPPPPPQSGSYRAATIRGAQLTHQMSAILSSLAKEMARSKELNAKSYCGAGWGGGTA